MRYVGLVRLGADDSAMHARVQIVDVEHPDWFALVLEEDDGAAELPKGEVSATLVDGLYEGWSGTAVGSRSDDNRWRLFGHVPLEPPVGS